MVLASDHLHSERMYSLRSYSQLLQVNPSTLSRILSGKRRVSRSLIEKVGDRLSLSPKQVASWLETERFSSAASQTYSLNSSNIQKEYQKEFQATSEDVFQIISEWYHFALLELLQWDESYSAATLGRRLGISQHETSLALVRLQKIGLIQKIEPKSSRELPRWKVVSQDNSFVALKGTSAARRALQKALLFKAQQAVDRSVWI